MKTNQHRIANPELTRVEKSIVGRPGDLVDEDESARAPEDSNVMFSLRVDRKTFEALSDLAEQRGDGSRT